MIYTLTYWHSTESGLVRVGSSGNFNSSAEAFADFVTRPIDGERVECHRYKDHTMVDPILVWSFESYKGRR